MIAGFQLGAFTVAPDRGTISSSAGSTRVEPKVMAVLLELVRRADQVTSKDDLLESVWAGTVVVDAVLTRCICLLRRALGDNRRGARYIETVPKRGYRLVARVASVAPTATAEGPRSIAVLPFREHGPAACWRRNEAADDLLASRLSQYPSFRVVSRTTMASSRGEAASLPELARALGADLLVEGAVLSGEDGSQLVLAQLFDGTSDRSLWSGERRSAAGDDPLAFGTAVRDLASELALALSLVPQPRAPRRLRLASS